MLAVEFPYSVKPKLRWEEIIDVKMSAAHQKMTAQDWVADAIRRKLKEDQSGRTSK